MRLKLSKLSRKFVSLRGSVNAVDSIDLDIKEGEFFVLLGPSGCGKSTLLNLIAGLEKPTRGEIWFGEKLVASTEKRIFLTPKERNVAFVFQSYALYPHLNVFENIAFPLKVTRERPQKIRESVEEASAMLGISDILLARPGELSGGQRQRVAIARAIVRRPNVFLLDEPLSNLDAQLRTSTRDEIKRLQRKLGVTTVYVTHDQVEALTLGDRIALLKQGGIEQTGTPEELYEKPANMFTASFIGSPAMNIFKAEVGEEKGNYYVKIGAVRIDMPQNKLETLKGAGKNSFSAGIRPEDLRLTNSPVSKGGVLAGRIDSIEHMGRERLLHISTGNERCSVLTTDTSRKEGESVNLEFNLNRLHIFPERPCMKEWI